MKGLKMKPRCVNISHSQCRRPNTRRIVHCESPSPRFGCRDTSFVLVKGQRLYAKCGTYQPTSVLMVQGRLMTPYMQRGTAERLTFAAVEPAVLANRPATVPSVAAMGLLPSGLVASIFSFLCVAIAFSFCQRKSQEHVQGSGMRGAGTCGSDSFP